MAWRYRSTPCAWAGLALLLATTPALAQKQYGPGVTDTEIKIGTTTPYSGPASAYSAGAISATAYFTMINQQGGVNGRKINYISLDDAYSPPKTVEQIRRLIESDEVLGFKRALGDKASTMIVSSLTYNTSDPTIDSQVVSLKASGADVFFIVTVPKFSAQAI